MVPDCVNMLHRHLYPEIFLHHRAFLPCRLIDSFLRFFTENKVKYLLILDSYHPSAEFILGVVASGIKRVAAI